MLLALFTLPLLAYLFVYLWFPKYRRWLPSVGAGGVALISLLALLYAVYNASLWTDGKRVVWSGVKSKTTELTVGGVQETDYIGWANGSFSPKLKASLAGSQIKLEISGGDAFVLDEKTNEYLVGEALAANQPKNLGAYSFQKIEKRFSSDCLQIRRGDDLLTEIYLPDLSKDKVFNLDFLVERTTQNITPEGDPNSRGCSNYFFRTTYTLPPNVRFKEIENLKTNVRDSRLLIRANGEIRLLAPDMTAQKNCEAPCRLNVLWSNSRVIAELDRYAGEDKIILRYLPPLLNSSPLPPAEAKNQLTIANQVSSGEFAYTLPLGKKEDGEKRKLDLSQMTESAAQNNIPEPFETVVKAPCLPPLCKMVEGQNMFYIFHLNQDLPSFWGIFFLSLLPFGLFVFGLYLLKPQFSVELECLLAGLIAAIWNFLILRLLLAVRYSLDPAYLDDHAVSGLTLSLAILAFLPGFLFLLARLRCDARRSDIEPEANRTMYLCFSFLGAIVFVFFVEIRYVQSLWDNIPESYKFSLGWKLTAVIIGIFVYLFAHIWIFYRYKTAFTDTDLGRNARIVKFIFIDVWNSFNWAATAGKDFWTQLFFEESITRPRFVKFWILSFLLFSLISLFVFVSGVDNLFVTHILIPFGLCWLPVAAWLAAKTIQTASDDERELHLRKYKLHIGAIMLISLLPLFLLPFALHDVGSIYAGFAIFISLFVILFKKSAGSRLFGWTSLIFLIFGVALVFTFYLNLDAFLGKTRSVGLGRAAPRILAFKDGTNFQHKILAADAGSNNNELGLNVIDLTNVHEHSWENKAIAFEGGLTGFGFGNAPVRLSQIRQDTLQFDSVYSFFIVGDFGLIGGLLLLLLYFVPLLLVYFCGRYKFDVGFCVALVICSVFLFDGLFHAAMNIGVAPFTGRDLPLLAVHSFKGDFLRWTVFFGLLINALYWRYSEDGEIDAEIACLLTNERNLQKQIDARNAETVEALQSDEAAPPKPKRNLWKTVYSNHAETWRQIAWLTVFPLLLLAAMVAAQISVYRDTDLRIFSWKILKDDIDWAIANKMIAVKPDEAAPNGRDCPKLALDENQYRLKWKDDGDLSNSFLNQQINRFNAASCDERIGQSVFPGVLQNLENVSDYASYQAFLNNLRESDLPARRLPKANLFALDKIRKDRLADENDYPFEVKFNPAFNIRRTFNETQNLENMPNVKTADNLKLFGAAWVKGKWITALDNPAMLSWTDWLADSMSLEWERLKNPTTAQAIYGTLSLDGKLQNAATAFIDQKGIQHHRQNLVGSGKIAWDKLPPRIGLTILRLSNGNNNGAVLALGSFPRATAGNKWRKISYGQDALWLPPAKLVEKRFPAFLRQLYGGDRNFENVAVMGSSTKPMWAEAVLSVHLEANLDRKFKVSGGAVNDDGVFGIKITDKNWTGHGSRQNWVNFDTFLTESNNRYQVLFGFLGLAQPNIPTESETSNSVLETMQTNAWKRYPKFDARIGFNYKNPQTIENLDKTELALRMRRIFGVATFDKTDVDQTGEYSSYLNSFWTKNENHDALKLLDGEEFLPQTNKEIQENLVPAILPSRLNLKLNRISKPRDFVTLLLGGSENRWSNVQAAAGFAAAVIGKPVLPHIVKNDQPPVFYGRAKDFVSLAKVLRPGLENVVFAENGTANAPLKRVKAFEILQQLKRKGFQIYAKTGTLSESGSDKSAQDASDENTTRLLLVIVKFEDAEKTKIRNGLVFSIFVEKSKLGTAAEWLGEFLVQNNAEITQILEP